MKKYFALLITLMSIVGVNLPASADSGFFLIQVGSYPQVTVAGPFSDYYECMKFKISNGYPYRYYACAQRDY